MAAGSVSMSAKQHVVPVAEQSALRCEECGEPLSPDEIFCGGCGAVSQVAARHFSQSRDTVALARIEAESLEKSLEEKAEYLPDFVAEKADDDLREGRMPVAVTPSPLQQPRQRPTLAPFHESDDMEATRISRPRLGERFVLQFSTGESSTVHGNGLIGRNPVSEPGEYFDQVVRVIDPSRSVSKTHLEFGQEAGSFWVMDRYSGNGTVVREPETDAIRCTPQRRYRIARGTRVDIGEQFFVVS